MPFTNKMPTRKTDNFSFLETAIWKFWHFGTEKISVYISSTKPKQHPQSQIDVSVIARL